MLLMEEIVRLHAPLPRSDKRERVAEEILLGRLLRSEVPSTKLASHVRDSSALYRSSPVHVQLVARQLLAEDLEVRDIVELIYN